MEIYYINSEEFLKTHDTNFLRKYTDGKEFKSMKRFVQYALGRFLVKSAAKNFYDLTDTDIIIENDKPKFKNSALQFSISHCGNFVAAAFDKTDCGLDIEEMKPRDFEALSKRYEKNFETSEDFYKFWTRYEAEIKLQQKTQAEYTCVFQDKFMLTVVSADSTFSQPSCISRFDV